MLSDMITTFTIDELPAEGVDKLAQASPLCRSIFEAQHKLMPRTQTISHMLESRRSERSMGCVWTLLAQQPWRIASGCWQRGRRLHAAACVRASLDADHSLQMEMRRSFRDTE